MSLLKLSPLVGFGAFVALRLHDQKVRFYVNSSSSRKYQPLKICLELTQINTSNADSRGFTETMSSSATTTLDEIQDAFKCKIYVVFLTYSECNIRKKKEEKF